MAKKNILHRSKLKKAKKLLSENKLEEANKILKMLSIQSPRDADVWLCLGYIAGNKKDYGLAYLRRPSFVQDIPPPEVAWRRENNREFFARYVSEASPRVNFPNALRYHPDKI